jgi:hypothetical protein
MAMARRVKWPFGNRGFKGKTQVSPHIRRSKRGVLTLVKPFKRKKPR